MPALQANGANVNRTPFGEIVRSRDVDEKQAHKMGFVTVTGPALEALALQAAGTPGSLRPLFSLTLTKRC